MVTTFLLLISVTFLVITQHDAFGDELLDNPITENGFKRYLGALAKNKQLSTVQQRSYLIPPMMSPHGGGGQRATFINDFDAQEKRYLGALARTGDLKYSKSQQQKKRFSDPTETEESLDTYRLSTKDDMPNPMIMKQEMITNLKPVILEYLNELKKKYDPRKVDLFLENLANAIYDQNEEITMENIKALVQSDYFQPEENAESKKKDELKRNIQSLVRELNVSYSGTTHPELTSRQIRSDYYKYDAEKRNLESLIKNKLHEHYMGTLATNYDHPMRTVGKREYDGDALEYLNENNSPYTYNEGTNHFQSLDKRHTMYDINEPDISYEYPSQSGESTDYNDYAEQMGQDAPIPIGKRYLGALARSGWLPQGFALRSGGLMSPGFEEKRHIGALARLGWLRHNGPSEDSPTYYFRGGRGRSFRPPSFRGPRAAFLKSEPQRLERCHCKRSIELSTSSSRSNLRGSNPRTEATRSGMLARQAADMLEKRFILLPAVDHFILRNLYPHLLRQ